MQPVTGSKPLSTVGYQSDYEYLDHESPTEIPHVASMISPAEKRLLFNLAKNNVNNGAIIDAGVFLGASTICFAEGLKTNPKADHSARIHTYELGLVNPNMWRFFERNNVDTALVTDGSFLPLLRSNVAPYGDAVQLHEGDITQHQWSGPIDILFIDVVKSPAILAHCFNTFLPHLKPGSIVVQQDYFIDMLPYLKAPQEHLSDYFDYIGEAHSSAVFVVTKPIDDAAIKEAIQLAHDADTGPSSQQIYDLIEQCAARTKDPVRGSLCRLSHAYAGTDLTTRANRLQHLIDTDPNLATAAEPRLQNAIVDAQYRVNLDNGRKLLLAGNADEAVELLRGAATSRPGSAADFVLARALSQAGRQEEALASIERVVAKRPSNAPAQTLYARVLARAGRHDEAKALAKTLADDNPDNQPSVQLLADLEKTHHTAANAPAGLAQSKQTDKPAIKKDRRGFAIIPWANEVASTAETDPKASLMALIDGLESLGKSRINHQEILSHLLFLPRLVQLHGHSKYGSKKALGKAKAIAKAIRSAGDLPDRRGYLEFGAGAHDPLSVPLLFHLNGFDRSYGNDMQEMRMEPYAAMSIADLILMYLADPAAFDLGLGGAVAPHGIDALHLPSLQAGQLTAGLQNLPQVKHLVGDIVTTDLEPESLSLVSSHAVLEHVDQLDEVLDFLYSRTARGGMHFHFIDLADHRSYSLKSPAGKFSFLAEEEPPGNTNRLRKSDQIGAFERAGFEILDAKSRNEPMPDEIRQNLVEPYASMSEDDLTCYSVTVVVRRN